METDVAVERDEVTDISFPERRHRIATHGEVQRAHCEQVTMRSRLAQAEVDTVSSNQHLVVIAWVQRWDLQENRHQNRRTM